ncbi:hypothetical protein [Erwinia oleae]|uniref:hypothetical protein n=1 Tax=Erwinia oleae TaxID=796334 RepID=UPI00054D9B8D|nr:hypothetical protein [Erwinia oleae]
MSGKLNVFCLCFVIVFLLSPVCQSKAYQQVKTVRQHENHEDRAVMAVYQAVKKYNLSTLNDHCIAYDFDDISDIHYFIVRVREINTDTICKGDYNISFNLFSFKVSRKDYSLLTDKDSKDGVFHPLH